MQRYFHSHVTKCFERWNLFLITTLYQCPYILSNFHRFIFFFNEKSPLESMNIKGMAQKIINCTYLESPSLLLGRSSPWLPSRLRSFSGPPPPRLRSLAGSSCKTKMKWNDKRIITTIIEIFKISSLIYWDTKRQVGGEFLQGEIQLYGRRCVTMTHYW